MRTATLTELLSLAHCGDLAELARELAFATTITHRGGGGQMTETEKLLDEAHWYARHDDLSEATYRLEQAKKCEASERKFNQWWMA